MKTKKKLYLPVEATGCWWATRHCCDEDGSSQSATVSWKSPLRTRPL